MPEVRGPRAALHAWPQGRLQCLSLSRAFTPYSLRFARAPLLPHFFLPPLCPLRSQLGDNATMEAMVEEVRRKEEDGRRKGE